MLNNKLEDYKKLYSKYVEHAVNLHNYHYTFSNFVGYQPGLGVKKSIRNMIRILRELRKAADQTYREEKRIVKEMKNQERLDRLKARLESKSIPKQKKERRNGNNKSATTKTI